MPSSWEIKLKIRILLNQSEIFFNVFINLEFFNDREDGVMTFKRFTKIFSEALNLSRCNRFPFKSSTTLNSKKLNKRKWISAHFCQVMSCQLSEDYIIIRRARNSSVIQHGISLRFAIRYGIYVCLMGCFSLSAHCFPGLCWIRGIQLRVAAKHW